MTAKGRAKPSRESQRPKVLESAMDAASAAMKDAEKAYAAAGLERKARFSLAEDAMQQAGKLAEEAVKTAMDQVEEAMDHLPHIRRSER
jgi:phosphate uptake regulator